MSPKFICNASTPILLRISLYRDVDRMRYFYYISDASIASAKGVETDFYAKMEELKQNLTSVELYLVRTHFL